MIAMIKQTRLLIEVEELLKTRRVDIIIVLDINKNPSPEGGGISLNR